MHAPYGNKIQQGVLSLQPMIPPKTIDIVPPDEGMSRRSTVDALRLVPQGSRTQAKLYKQLLLYIPHPSGVGGKLKACQSKDCEFNAY